MEFDLEWVTGLISTMVFSTICGMLAYSFPGGMIFLISMLLFMFEFSVISFDLGMIAGITSVALLRLLILPLLARLGLFPERKEITLSLEVIILFGFGLTLILTTHSIRMLT